MVSQSDLREQIKEVAMLTNQVIATAAGRTNDIDKYQ
jgi:hypothetical protein